jgi:DNA-binding CsgD family transcriptional regulator
VVNRTRQTAVRLRITVPSVETYRSRLMEKLACSSPADHVRYAIRNGLVGP